MQQVDDPPSLPVGTEVSAKYKGAFCEAKVRKVVRNIKVKVIYKQAGLGSGIVPDDAIKTGNLRVGATVEVKHPEKRELVEATITKIQDGSQYTVVFDDGDITTLRRTALCLKSGRHFNESETLDQLPLTHPEHFSNPVIGGRRGRRSRHLNDDSSDEEEEPVKKGKQVVNEKEENIGRVVCVETTDAKKKDKYFPGLVVAPTAQATVKIRVKDEYLVRSFKDGRYYTVPKKEAINFIRESASKMDGPAVQAAINFIDNNELPPHWDRDSLFGLSNSSSDYEGEVDSDSSDDEPTEEKDHFVAQLYKYMDDRGTPLNKVPSIQNRDVDLYRLFRTVQKLGGYNRVTSQNQWKSITNRLGFTPVTVSVTNLVKQAYKKFLQPYEEFHRKLGCSMIMTSRGSARSKGRSLVRANSVASPKPDVKILEKSAAIAAAANASSVNISISMPSTSPAQISASEFETKSKIKIEPEESEVTSESSVEIPVKNVKRKSSTGSNTKVKTLIDKFEEKQKEEEDIKQEEIKKEVKREKESSEPLLISSKEIPTGSSNSSVPIKPRERGRPLKTFTFDADLIRKIKKKIYEDFPLPEKVLERNRDTNVDFPVEVGDKLKVYYHEKRVTYEAKVIEISLQQGTPLYMVHYTGWNNRYDEWIPKDRIAENLTNTRSKKSKISQGNQPAKHISEHLPLTKFPTERDKEKLMLSSNPATASLIGTVKAINSSKRGRGRSDSQPPRSTTPSSIVSNSSRTKSPATPVSQRRKTRNQLPSNRRASNNVSDISMQTDSDSDSDTPVIKKTNKSLQIVSSTSSNTSTITMISNFKTNTLTNPKSCTVSTSALTVPVLSTNIEESSLKKSSIKSDEEEDDESAKGRDYDLNQIRSELKGFKELKSPTPEPDEKQNDSLFEIPKKIPDKNEDDKHSDSSNNVVKVPISEPKSSSEFSSECDSFGDDDSQSSDKTTQLENMTKKLQQKINAEKLAHATAVKNADKSGIQGKNSTPEKLSPFSSSGIEKIIKDSLAEKRQETMKASKPFLIEKSIFKCSSLSIGPGTSEEKTEKSLCSTQQSKQTLTPITILKTDTNISRLQLPRQISCERKLSQVPSLTEQKKPQLCGIDTKMTPVLGLRPEKKPILTAKANASLAAAAAAAQAADVSLNQTVKKDIFIAPTTGHKHESKQSSDVKSLSAQFQHKANISGMGIMTEKCSAGLIPKSNLAKEIIKVPTCKASQTLQNSTVNGVSDVSTSDIYEFKEPEPFEFEARKTGPASHSLSQSFEIEKKKKPLLKSFDQVESCKTLPTTQNSAPTLMSQVTITSASVKKTKKSPIKDSDTKLLKKLKLDDRAISETQASLISVLSINQNIATTNISTSPTSTHYGTTATQQSPNLSIKSDSTFDVLRKSPSFNLNINALNEELATAVQETTKVLTDITVPNTPIPMTSANTISSAIIQKPTFINTFVETGKSSSLVKPQTTSTKVTAKILTSVQTYSSLPIKPVLSLAIKQNTGNILKTTSTSLSSKTISSTEKPTLNNPVMCSETSNKQTFCDSTKKNSLTGFSIPTPLPELLNVFELKQEHDPGGKSGSDDDHDKNKETNELETVKKMLADPGILEPPKIEKSSIADKVLKALNLQKEDEKSKENIATGLTAILENKSTSVNISKPVLKKLEGTTASPNIKSPIPFGNLSPSNTSNLTSGIINTTNRLFSSSPIFIEPPKIEMSALIKKDFDNALRKPVLNSPEHKINILECMTPKNNDLTETIQKLESAIKTTSNVDHFEADSSDSTDSEQRLVIEDDESSDNQANDTLSAPEYSPLKKQDILSSPMKTLSQATLLLPQTSIILKTTKSNIEKYSPISSPNPTIPDSFTMKKQQTPEQSIFTLTSSNTTTVTAIGPNGNTTNVFGLQGSLFSNPTILSDSDVKPICELPSNFKQDFPLSLSVTAVKRSELNSPPELSITPLKKEEISNINQESNNLTSESINLLLCEETIPGSPTPVPTKEISMEQNIKISTIHPTESDIKPIPMDIEICSTHVSNSHTLLNNNNNINKIKNDNTAITISNNNYNNNNNNSNNNNISDNNCKGTSTRNNHNLENNESNNINNNNSNTNSNNNNNVEILSSSHPDGSNIVQQIIQPISNIGGIVGEIVVSQNVTKVEPQTPSSSPHDSQSQDDSSEDLKKQMCPDLDDVSPKKRRRNRTHSEAQSHHGKRRRSNRVEAKKHNPTKNVYCSDSDDNSDTNGIQRTSTNRPIRPCPYNFLVQLDPNLNPNQRISILRKKITDLRKTYIMIKAELASIDRRRKKLRRREREKKIQQKQQQQLQQQQQIQSQQQYNV